MSGLIKLAVIGAVIAGIGLWIAEGVERQNVRDCLAQLNQQYGIARGHDIYLTDVIEVEIYRTYGDNTATRFIKYLIQGSHDLQSATCRW